MRAAGGRLQTGRLKVKTIVIENLADGASFPYVGGLYAEKVQKAMGRQAADKIFRLYYQENAGHGASLMTLPGKPGPSAASVGGILHQALLDLADWAERGVAPLPSTRYRRDAMNQVMLPARASERFGHQPVLHLTADGGKRVEVAVNVPVDLVSQIEMPPRAGKIVQYRLVPGRQRQHLRAGDEAGPPASARQCHAHGQLSKARRVCDCLARSGRAGRRRPSGEHHAADQSGSRARDRSVMSPQRTPATNRSGPTLDRP